jgi:hypothetical protein
MSKVYITEFRGVLSVPGTIERLPMQVAWGILDAHAIDIGVSSVQSPVFEAAARVIRVKADAACTISIGQSPTATATNHIQLDAGETDYFGVSVGDRVAVIERAIA